MIEKSSFEEADRKVAPTAIGHHWLIEFSNCNPSQLSEVKTIEAILLEAAHRIKATVLSSSFHQFAPVGVSGVIIIQESHLTIHTWPEHHYAAVDIFTCGKSIEPQAGVEYLQKALEAVDVKMKYVERKSS